jgi:pimeloyl-ACP methyl ester carboxylesterase
MRGALMTAVSLALVSTAAPSGSTPNAAVVDPPRDAKFPAHNQQLLIPSHGVGMNALLFAASGKGPHPTVILMHGLPGNERNLDLAQAMRRAGWDVLTFTYRGAWGSPGTFSIANSIEDTAAALEFARSPAGAKLGIDPRHIILAGHSMGGATAGLTAAEAKGLDGLILLDAWNIASTARSQSRAQLVSGFDDFGNSLAGATPETTAEEVLAKGRSWDLVQAAPKWARIPVLFVTAKYSGGTVENRPVVEALRKAGDKRVTAVELASDHPFSDHRIALAETVVRWLQQLPASR